MRKTPVALVNDVSVLNGLPSYIVSHEVQYPNAVELGSASGMTLPCDDPLLGLTLKIELLAQYAVNAAGFHGRHPPTMKRYKIPTWDAWPPTAFKASITGASLDAQFLVLYNCIDPVNSCSGVNVEEKRR